MPSAFEFIGTDRDQSKNVGFRSKSTPAVRKDTERRKNVGEWEVNKY